MSAFDDLFCRSWYNNLEVTISQGYSSSFLAVLDKKHTTVHKDGM
jgi:hypothetical protein